MKDPASALKVLDGLRADLKELIGTDAAERLYVGLLGQPQIWDTTKSKFTTLKAARIVARQLLEAKRDAENPGTTPEEPPQEVQ
jgi:hypothetical protein